MPCLSVLLVVALLHPAVKATDLTSYVNLLYVNSPPPLPSRP